MGNFNEYLEREKKTWSLWQRFSFWFDTNITPRFHRLTKGVFCSHAGIMGPVGAKKHLCIDCQKIVPNPTWKEDRKVLSKPKKE